MPLQFASQLSLLGWDDWFQERFALFASEGYAPARVIADFGAEYLLHDGEESLRAAAGRHLRNDGGQLPAVGDWVAFRHGEPVGTIHGWVERKTAFSRKVASVETKEQVLAANVDVAFVVASAQDVNARRIERYLTMAWQSGALPDQVRHRGITGRPAIRARGCRDRHGGRGHQRDHGRGSRSSGEAAAARTHRRPPWPVRSGQVDAHQPYGGR